MSVWVSVSSLLVSTNKHSEQPCLLPNAGISVNSDWLLNQIYSINGIPETLRWKYFSSGNIEERECQLEYWNNVHCRNCLGWNWQITWNLSAAPLLNLFFLFNIYHWFWAIQWKFWLFLSHSPLSSATSPRCLVLPTSVELSPSSAHQARRNCVTKTNWRKETNWDSGSCTKRGLHLLNAFTVVQGWADFSILRRSSSCFCKMEFIPRVKQIRWSQNVGREPVYSGEDNPDITSPSPSDVYTSFSAEKLKSGRYYQALGYPWPNIGLNTGPQHSEPACHRFMSF